MDLPALSRWRTGLLPLPRLSGGIGEITLAGTMADSEGAGHPRMRVFGQWALVYLVAGGGLYRDQRGFMQKMVPGDWILVFPELAHSYGPSGGDRWDEVYVCFRGPVFEAWREAGVLDPAHPTGHWTRPERGVRALGNFFDKIHQRNISPLKAVCLWQEMLAEIVGGTPKPATMRDVWLGNAMDLLEDSGTESGVSGLRRVAEACGMNYESFRKKFQSAVGMSPGRYALSRRIEHARRLLALQSLTNAEIAGMLGFYDEFHFSKTFSHWTGTSPRQFRKTLRAD